MHTLILDPEGNVWTVGKNTENQVDRDSDIQIKPKPGKIQLPETILQVACTNYSSFCLDTGGFVWGFGDNINNELGLNEVERRKINVLPEPTIIQKLINIVSISCGDSHTGCIDSDNNVWTFGLNRDGQLGRPGNTEPKKVALENIRFVSCGANHTIFINSSNELFSAGSNASGQLGIGICGKPSNDLVFKVPSICDIDYVVSGTCFSHCFIKFREVYGWGSNCYGQLALEHNEYLSPTKVNLNYDIAEISCGYTHSLFKCEDKKVLVCGRNDFGQLGLTFDAVHFTSVPRELNLPPISTLSFGGVHTILQDEDGVSWGFGCDSGLGFVKPDGICRTPSKLDIPFIIRKNLNRAKSARK